MGVCIRVLGSYEGVSGGSKNVPIPITTPQDADESIVVIVAQVDRDDVTRQAVDGDRLAIFLAGEIDERLVFVPCQVLCQRLADALAPETVKAGLAADF